jgi:hypothetical protein
VQNIRPFVRCVGTNPIKLKVLYFGQTMIFKSEEGGGGRDRKQTTVYTST